MRICRLIPLLLALLLSGCASTPVLIPRDAAVPPGVDLSGRWLLQTSEGAQGTRMGRSQEPIVPGTRSSRLRRQRDSGDGAVQVFLEYGRILKISQTPHGLFISYDRSIVEEYRFGENRRVNVGPISARRVSGWENNAFVVETVDESGTFLLETWTLDKAAGTLVRMIQLRKGKEIKFEQQQVFGRE